MINIIDIAVKYGDRILLNDISATIGHRDRIGLVGRNGAGKSTLLKIIAKYQLPDSGTVAFPKETTLGFLHQDLNLPKGKTVINETLTAFKTAQALEARIEKINELLATRTDYTSTAYQALLIELSDITDRFQLLGGSTMRADAEKVLNGLGFKNSDLTRLTDEFSGGWKMRIELAKILLQQPNYLLLDEPTNHLDIESILWLEQYLKTYEGAIIIISHDKTFLDNVTTRTIEIENGHIYDYKAPYSKYRTLRAERKAKQESAYKNQQRVIAHKEKLINKFIAKANKTKFAQSLQKELARMERVEIDQEDNKTMRLTFPPAARSGRMVVLIEQLIKHYGKVEVLNDVDFQLERGERIAFVGQNGQGKTTLSKIIAGIEPLTSGKCELGHNVEIGYYAQNQSELLDESATILEVMEHHAPANMRTKLRHILGGFMFSGEDVDKKVSVLSGGERARLAMACMLLHPFNLLILDEPTNHLDIRSKEVLKNALKSFDGTLIIVSHDRDFLQGLTNRILEFRDHKLYNYIGDIQAFLQKRKVANMRQVEMTTQSKSTTKVSAKTSKLSYEERKNQQKIKRRLEKKVEKYETKIEEIEATIEDFNLKMAAPTFYNQPNANDVIQTYQKTKKLLDEAMENWENAQLELDEFMESMSQ